MPLSKIPVGDDPPREVNVIIENPLGGDPVKYELDKASGAMFVDRFLHTAMYYPGNYGFVPHTLSGDGDPVDVLVVGRVPVMPGAVMRSRPVGVLVMEDEAGEDEKILAVPVDKLHPYFTDVASYQDLPQILLDQVSHFFSHYKDLEKGKWSRILRWGGPEEAGAMIMAGVARARERGDAPPPPESSKAQSSILKKPAPEPEPVLERVADGAPQPTEDDGAPLVTKWTSKLFGRGDSDEEKPQPIEEAAASEPVPEPVPEPTPEPVPEPIPEPVPEPVAEPETPRVDPIVAAGLAPEPDPVIEIQGRVEILVGDITKLKVDVIANSANERLRSSGGVDGAIHRAAGPDLQKACNELGGCPTGMCKMTDAFDLPAKAVIHCVGPVWHGGERGEEGLLASCYRSALELAAEKGMESIAFPAISTGIYGFPGDRAAEIASRVAKEFLADNMSINRIVFVCFDPETEEHYKSALPELA